MRIYIAHYLQQEVQVRADTPFQAQLKAASALGVSPTKAHYIIVRSSKYNAGGDRYTRCYGSARA